MQRSAANSTLGQAGPGTPVDLKLLFWGFSLLLVGVYLWGAADEDHKPLRRRKVKRVAGDPEAESALVNMGFSEADARRGVAAAKRKGARGIDATVREALAVLR